jgi:hypothetical protein
VIPAKQSAAFVCQMEKVLAVYERAYDAHYPVVCMDASPKQLIDYKQFTGSDGKQYQDSEYIRKGVAELFVAFEPLAGHRQMSLQADHKATTWVHFLAQQMDTTYQSAHKVSWVMDNLSTHRVENFYEVFPPAQAKAYLDRMEVIYTPKHGSWLNMAEIEFAVITRQEFDRPFTDKEAVEKVVERWKNERNNRKAGANWQFKTADARIKLKKLYPTI